MTSISGYDAWKLRSSDDDACQEDDGSAEESQKGEDDNESSRRDYPGAVNVERARTKDDDELSKRTKYLVGTGDESAAAAESDTDIEDWDWA